jgi:ADP-ribose pyrophosphatase YjhB (NUDIX family)
MELRDLYNINKEKTNETIYSTEETPENRYILVQLVLIQNSKGQILIQKRSQQKGGEYALTSGHAKSGETPLQGIISEIKEELGLDVAPEELRLIHSERNDTKRNFYDLLKKKIMRKHYP